MKVTKKRKYRVFYQELPYGGIGRDVLFSKSKAKIMEDFKQYRHIRILKIIFLGWKFEIN